MAAVEEPLAGKNTAKRQIQIRRYMQRLYNTERTYSDPFAQDENDDSQILRVGKVKYSFKTDYIADKESDDDQFDRDEILIAKESSLDEADRVIAALKIPRNKESVSIRQQKVKKVKLEQAFDLLAEFKEQSKKLEELRRAEAVEESEGDDELI